MTQISILGCGWLGLPLAKTLTASGFSVNGSTTSTDKMSMIKEAGINPFLISLSENTIDGAIDQFLENSTILIIDIPPKLRGLVKENFVAKIENVIPFIEKSTVKNIIFISSTSVYGEKNDLVTEATILNPDTESGKRLVQAEMLLQNNKYFKTTVLRFGGLIGEDRNPIHFLAGKVDLENPNAPINLIHQQDCIGIILKIIETQSWNETFNAVAPFHPSRKEYYTQKAIELNLALPQFIKDESSSGKIILSGKVENVLKYNFQSL